MTKIAKISAALAAASLVAACGGGGAPKADKKAAAGERGIFISATDCAEGGKMSAEVCAKAIDAAIAAHDKTAPTFKTMKQCTDKQGGDRCSLSADGQYRPRVQAFLVTMGAQPTAETLYPPAGKLIGFKSLSKPKVDAKDDTMVVSNAAMALAHENSKLGK